MSDPALSGDPVATQTSGVRILLDGVTKRYDAKGPAAVDDITIEFPAGEIVMLVGPRGAARPPR